MAAVDTPTTATFLTNRPIVDPTDRRISLDLLRTVRQLYLAPCRPGYPKLRADLRALQSPSSHSSFNVKSDSYEHAPRWTSKEKQKNRDKEGSAGRRESTVCICGIVACRDLLQSPGDDCTPS